MSDQPPPMVPPPVPPHLRRGHAGDRTTMFRAFAFPVGAILPIAVAVIFLLNDRRGVNATEVVAILLGAVVLGLAMGGLVLLSTGAASQGLVQMISGSGNLAPSPSFSYQESLVIRGRADEAAEVYRDHLTAHPEDQDARLALADLLAGHLADPSGAERLWLEIRNGIASPLQERRATESLIAHYRRTGNTGREMAELARLADRFRGTEAGEAARRALATLKRAASEDRRLDGE